MPTAFRRPSSSRPVTSQPRGPLPALPLLVAAMVLVVLALPDWEVLQDWKEHWPIGDALSEHAALPACRTSRPQVTIPVLDVSSSVIDPGGADPKGRSFDETRLLARALQAAPCTRDDRFGAVIFAGDTVEVPPTLVSSASIIERNLVRPPASEIGSGTDLGRALELTKQVAGRHPSADITVVILSDMGVGDPSGVEAQLASLGASRLHLIGLGRHDPQFDALFDSVTVLEQVERGAVARALSDAVASSRRTEPAAPAGQHTRSQSAAPTSQDTPRRNQ